MKEDTNPIETREWLDALDEVVKHCGAERASFLLLELAKHAMDSRLRLPSATTTPFSNTILPAEEKMMPGDLFMERRIRSLVRWNALAMVMRANDNDEGLGGHISSFSSSATLYDVGFNYFFRGTEGGTRETWCFTRGTVRRVCMRAPTWRAGWTRHSWTSFGAKSMAMDCRPIPIPG